MRELYHAMVGPKSAPGRRSHVTLLQTLLSCGPHHVQALALAQKVRAVSDNWVRPGQAEPSAWAMVIRNYGGSRRCG